MTRAAAVDLAEVERRLQLRRALIARQNARHHALTLSRIARAARLPEQAQQGRQGAPNSTEPAPVAGAPAPTTSTRSGGLSGCSSESA